MVWPILTEASFYRYIIIAPIVFLACWFFNKYRIKKNMKYYEEHKDEIENKNE